MTFSTHFFLLKLLTAVGDFLYVFAQITTIGRCYCDVRSAKAQPQGSAEVQCETKLNIYSFSLNNIKKAKRKEPPVQKKVHSNGQAIGINSACKQLCNVVFGRGGMGRKNIYPPHANQERDDGGARAGATTANQINCGLQTNKQYASPRLLISSKQLLPGWMVGWCRAASELVGTLAWKSRVTSAPGLVGSN